MSEITFESGGETMVLKMEHITGVAKFDATPSDIAAVLDQHPEIAEKAGWVRINRERVYQTVSDVLHKHTCNRIMVDGQDNFMDLADLLEDSDIDEIANACADDVSTPSVDELVGIAPDYTGGLSTDEFMDRQRGRDGAEGSERDGL